MFGTGNWTRRWGEAVLLLGVPVALFDALYVVPVYHIATGGALFMEVAEAYLRFILGPILILIGALGPGFAFNGGADWYASALVIWALVLPLVSIAAFYVEGPGEVPPAYWLFQYIITDSGASQVDADHFDADNYAAKVQRRRQDRYQAEMEARELREAEVRARAEAQRAAAEARRMAREYPEHEAERYRAAADAARAAEEKARSRAREQAWRDQSGGEGRR